MSDYKWSIAGATCASSSCDPLTLEKLQELHDELFAPPIIKVWHGDNFLMLPRPECPRFIESDMVDDETMFICAGIGIVAGSRIQDLLWKEGFLAIWSDEPVEYN